MNNNVRRSDSLAHETGTLKRNLDEMNTLWNTDISEILEISPQIITWIKEVLSSKDKVGAKKEQIMESLTKLGELYNNMERIGALMYDLMIEIDGLEFPLKYPKKLMKLSKEEIETTKLLQTFAKNISKTMAFAGNSNMEEELLASSLKSFESTFNEYQSAAEKSREMLKDLQKELDDEHMKARKYVDYV